MINIPGNSSVFTASKVVLPFYVYAGISFLTSTLLLLCSPDSFTQHHFHPHTLAITHAMALGWGSMMILGASHQFVPVLVGGSLYSTRLAQTSFLLAGTGIPVFLYALYTFNMKWPAISGSILIVSAMMAYLINISMSILKSKIRNVQSAFIMSATLWFLLTGLIGFLLVCNFSDFILPESSIHYLSLHANIGIIGWFLLLVIGVGSRLIPMFLISKYSNNVLLWWIYSLINSGLVIFILLFFLRIQNLFFMVPAIFIGIALMLFAYFCFQSFQQRIRRQVDDQMKISLLSVLMMLVPIIVLISIITLLLFSVENYRLVLLYGFSVFFGWITAMIFGMTFKTLPFIMWNKLYQQQAGLGLLVTPKDLFSAKVFTGMGITYIFGFLFFTIGILNSNLLFLKSGTVLLLLSAVLYNWNLFSILLHKPAK